MDKTPDMYVIVDQGICTACGSCMCWSPDVFAYNELSIAYNRLDNNTGTVPVPDAIKEDVLPTGYCCPTRAIKISSQPFTNFQPTAEFGTESPDNPNITYEIADNEWSINELTPTTKSECGCGGDNCTCGGHNDGDNCGCGGSCSC